MININRLMIIWRCSENEIKIIMRLNDNFEPKSKLNEFINKPLKSESTVLTAGGEPVKLSSLRQDVSQSST